MANLQGEELGTIKISDDVIMVCTANAVSKIPGVSELAGGLTESISKNILGIDSSSKGVKLSRNDAGIILDIYIIVEYKVKIPQLAWEIQSNVKKEIESITDLNVLEVNIHVQGVNLPGEEDKKINDKNGCKRIYDAGFFQMEACGDFDVNNRATYFKDNNFKAQKEYCHELYSLVCNKKEEIDQEIDKYSKNWKASRMPKTDLAIIRLAACEILYLENIPDAVSINEAVDLAKTYGTEDSAKYVNAILGKIAAKSSDADE